MGFSVDFQSHAIPGLSSATTDWWTNILESYIVEPEPEYVKVGICQFCTLSGYVMKYTYWDRGQ